MSLIITLTFLSFLNAIIPFLTKRFVPWICKKSTAQHAIAKEIYDLRQELNTISMTDNFAVHAKTQRKINKLSSELKEENEKHSSKVLKLRLSINYGFRIVIGICIAYVAIFYRYTPVVVFSDRFDFTPFTKIVSFPVNEPGAISVHMWIVMTNVFSKAVLSKVA